MAFDKRQGSNYSVVLGLGPVGIILVPILVASIEAVAVAVIPLAEVAMLLAAILGICPVSSRLPVVSTCAWETPVSRKTRKLSVNESNNPRIAL